MKHNFCLRQVLKSQAQRSDIKNRSTECESMDNPHGFDQPDSLTLPQGREQSSLWWRWLGCFFVGLMAVNGVAQAEPFRDVFRYGSYGLVAGALAGGTVMALSDDPGAKWDPIAKGASLGLYTGLLVAFYNNMESEPPSNLIIRPLASTTKEGGQSWGFLLQGRFSL